jgi:hypothetical protein
MYTFSNFELYKPWSIWSGAASFSCPEKRIIIEKFFFKLLFEQEDVGSGGSMLEAYC